MNANEFFSFVKDRYGGELAEIDRLYSRIPIALSANVIVAGIITFLTTGEYFDKLFDRADIFIYYLCAGLGGFCIAVSCLSLSACMTPRSYLRLDLPSRWQEWRIDYETKIRSTGYEYSDEAVEEYVAEATQKAVQEQMIAYTNTNFTTTERRFWYFNAALGLTTISLIPVILQGVFSVLIAVQE